MCNCIGALLSRLLLRLRFPTSSFYNYIFLKTCTVMCEVIQLLYSNECTHDQYPFNAQMRTGTALVPSMDDKTNPVRFFTSFPLLNYPAKMIDFPCGICSRHSPRCSLRYNLFGSPCCILFSDTCGSSELVCFLGSDT